jgi:ElaB/YqjD/DUF883 family membrane-anchored ribosome-binding protein
MSHAAASHAHNSDKEALMEKTVAVKDAVVDLAGEAKNFASHRVSDVRDTASEWIDTAKEKASDANTAVIKYVQKNPFKSIAIAVGVGFVAGMLLKRR